MPPPPEVCTIPTGKLVGGMLPTGKHSCIQTSMDSSRMRSAHFGGYLWILVMLLLAECDLSSLSCVCLYVDHPRVYTPNAPSRTIGSNQLTNQSKQCTTTPPAIWMFMPAWRRGGGGVHPLPIHTPYSSACWDTHPLPKCMVGYTHPFPSAYWDTPP